MESALTLAKPLGKGVLARLGAVQRGRHGGRSGAATHASSSSTHWPPTTSFSARSAAAQHRRSAARALAQSRASARTRARATAVCGAPWGADHAPLGATRGQDARGLRPGRVGWGDGGARAAPQVRRFRRRAAARGRAAARSRRDGTRGASWGGRSDAPRGRAGRARGACVRYVRGGGERRGRAERRKM